MPRVGFEHAIPVLQRAKTVQALDRSAAVIGRCGCARLRSTEVYEYYRANKSLIL
jgi:hypothetical protein